MSTPGPPNINILPLALPNKLVYDWAPPTNPNGTISAYKLLLTTGGSNAYSNATIPASRRRYAVGPPEITLINGVTYATTLQAINENGEGEVASFIDFQPGSAPTLGPSTATALAIGSNAAAVFWTPPSSLPDATIFWYTINSRSNNLSDPIFSYTAGGLTQSNYYITGLNNASSYYFDITAVNCPGYSPAVSTNTINFGVATDYVFEASFLTTSNTTGFSNYDTNRLMVNTPTGSGYSYLTTWNYTASNSLYKSYTSITTNTVSYICSVYRNAAATQYTGIMMSRTPTGNGLNMFDATNLSYIWQNATSLNTGITLPLNEWVQLALTISSSNAKWYVNGELAYTNTTSHVAQTMSDVYIGTDSAVASTRTFPGYIDNIRFYTRTLSDSEVYSIYKYYQAPQSNTAIPTTVTGLQAWYDGSDPLGTGTAPSSGSIVSTWYDKSGNTRNANGTSSPTYTLGNYGRINLNGTTQYYTLSTSSFIANQNFTIFVVEKLQGNASSLPALFGGTSGSTNANLSVLYKGTNAVNITLSYYNNDLVATNSTNAFSIAGAQPIRIWAFRQIASQRSMWVNGNPFSQDANNTLLSSWAGAQIGRFATANYYNGQMLDLLFYIGTISITNMQQILAYLAQKWYVSLPPFIPPRVTGLVLWLDANDSSSFTLSGSNVTQWRDKSGSGNHFSVVSGTPTRITDGSLTVVNISGGTIMTGTSSISFTTSYSIFVVTKVTAPNNVGSGGIQNFMDVSTKSIRYVGASGSLSTLQLNGGPNSTPNADDLVSIFQVNGSRNATASSVYTAYHMFDGPPQASVSGIPRLSTGFESRYFNGNVCEILIFNTAMINLNREKVQGYLAWKWGINSLLPSTHTYYAVAPAF
jgi:hypothetical protein